MKKKLFIFISMMLLVLPFGVAKADISSTIDGACKSVVSNIYQGARDQAFDACKKTAKKIDIKEHCRNEATGDQAVCVFAYLCALTSYENTDTCTKNNVTTSEKVAEAKDKIKDASIKTVCSAICDDLYNNGREWNECMGSGHEYSKENGCVGAGYKATCAISDQDCFKRAACKVYPNAKFCNVTSVTPTEYNNLTQKHRVQEKYTIEEGGKNGSGTINDDLNRMEGYNAGNCYGFGEVVYYASLIIRIFQVCAPILLIIWASVDLLRSVIAGDEKKIIEMRKPIIKRFVSAALVFLVPWMVETLIDSFAVSKEDSKSWFTCWKDYRYGVDVNREHLEIQDNELKYIEGTCEFACLDKKNPANCKKKCISDYWTYDDVCYNAVSSSGNDDKTEDARQSCYNDYAKEWLEYYTDKE